MENISECFPMQRILLKNKKNDAGEAYRTLELQGIFTKISSWTPEAQT